VAVEAYPYGHFPIVAGIVLAGLGVEGVLAHAGDSEPLGAFYALPLFGGMALYLAGQLLFERRIHRALSVPRLVAAGVLLAALIVVETTRYAQTRRDLRGA
jgi:low temperature requirement protein LtrA